MVAPILYEYHLTVDDNTIVYNQAINAYEMMRKGVSAGKRVTLFRKLKTISTENALQRIRTLKTCSTTNHRDQEGVNNETPT